MKHFIITGSSRGLGESIVKQLFKANHHLHCISRNSNQMLVEIAKEENITINEYGFDLSKVEEIEELMDRIFFNIDLDKVEEITLVNNAGIIHPIKPIDRAGVNDIISNVQVNLLAPMILSKTFIKKTEMLKIKKYIINISSGAGKRPIPSWSIYCSSKAGLDLFSRTIAEEQRTVEHPVKVLSIAPGVVDTKMQDEIRSSNVEDFSSVEQFRRYKEEGSLFSADMVAEKIISVLYNDSIENGAVLDIRTYI